MYSSLLFTPLQAPSVGDKVCLETEMKRKPGERNRKRVCSPQFSIQAPEARTSHLQLQGMAVANLLESLTMQYSVKSVVRTK
jgi:hypothetical protein